MIGNLLITNILEQNQKVREVYLPQGSSWYDYYTGEVYDGGQTIFLNVDIESIPIFVREGTIMPINKAKSGFNDFDKKIVYKVFPAISFDKTEHNIYIDDGETNGYLDGDSGNLLIKLTSKDSVLNVDWQYKGSDKFKISNLQVINMNKDLEYNA